MVDVEACLAGMDDVVEAAFREHPLPGLAVGVVHGDQLVHVKGLGHASIEDHVPIEGHTTFRLASISKTFTTVGIMQLHEAGKLDLDAPVNDYLASGRVVVKPGWPAVTVRHLLTHQAGFGELFAIKDAFKPGFGLTVIGKGTVVPPLSSIHARDYSPDVPAGTKHAYSNIGFSLLGYVMEQVTEKPFRDCMLDGILDPLGMQGSDFCRSERVASTEATGYRRARGKWAGARYYQNIISPAGNLISSMQDMARYVAMLLGKGTLAGTRVVGEGSIDEMLRPQYWAHDGLRPFNAMGLSFFLHERNGLRLAEHGGATSGYTAYMTLVPSARLGIMVFSNKDEIMGNRATQIVKERVLSHLLGPRAGCAKGTPVASESARRFEGYYGAPHGFLTSTRVYMYHGGDAKVSWRDGNLVLSTFYGPRRKGVALLPCEVPLVFDTGQEHVAFHAQPGQAATAVSTGLVTLVRRRFVATFRVKVVALGIAVATLVVMVLLLAVTR